MPPPPGGTGGGIGLNLRGVRWFLSFRPHVPQPPNPRSDQQPDSLRGFVLARLGAH